jgi:hypothetical protein
MPWPLRVSIHIAHAQCKLQLNVLRTPMKLECPRWLCRSTCIENGATFCPDGFVAFLLQRVAFSPPAAAFITHLLLRLRPHVVTIFIARLLTLYFCSLIVSVLLCLVRLCHAKWVSVSGDGDGLKECWNRANSAHLLCNLHRLVYRFERQWRWLLGKAFRSE